MTEYKLSELLEIKNGKDHKHLPDGDFPVYGSGGFMRSVDTYLYDQPSILLPRKGSLNNIQYADTPFWTVDTLYYTIIDKTKVNPYYLYCYLSRLDLSYLDSGTGVPSMTFDSYYNIKVILPELSTQNSVARILYSINQKIACNRAINHYLEAMAKQLYDYWFVQFDFPDENGKPYKSSGGKMVWNEKLKREIPEGWSGGCFSDIANITMGQSPDGSSYNEVGNGVIFYQGSTDFGIRFPSVRMYTIAPTRFAKRGDILMSVRAPVGAVNIANADCCIGRGLSAINAKIGTITYIYFVIHYLKVRFDNLNSAGTTFGSITKDELHGLPVVVPSDDVLKLFESASKPIFDMQMNIGQEIEGLTLQHDELLPLLMNGQVSIKQLNNDLANG